MKQPYLCQVRYLTMGLLLFCCFVSCSRSSDHHQLDLQTNYRVYFKVSGFETQISPLEGRLASGRIGASMSGTLWRNQEQYLYFWSFNDTSLVPDIALNSQATVTCNPGQSTPIDFAAGYAKDSFPAGLSLSIRGLESIVFQMPLSGAASVTAFGFDMGSSNTGPKDFTILYSNDGSTYHTLSASNPFTNMSSQARNSYAFRLDTLPLDLHRSLYIKILPLAGDRSQVSGYNPATGVTRIDNVYLMGTRDTNAAFPYQQLEYFIFRESDSMLYAHGSIDLAQHDPDFQLNLPAGRYLAHLVAYFSQKPLIWSDTLARASTHFLANAPDNAQASIYGFADTLSVYGDQLVQTTLKRYYSQIQFQFTDPEGLDRITEVWVVPLHAIPYYAPFNPLMNRPEISYTGDSVFRPRFDVNSGSFAFNQFLGNLMHPVPLRYRIYLFGQSGLLRQFEVSHAIPNNVKLTFKGRALSYGTGFGISLDEQWQSEQEIDF